MPLQLPLNVGPIAKLCDKNGATRFAAGAVHVIDPGDGTYRLEVTDGRVAVILRGNYEEPSGEKAEFLIPAAALQETFAAMSKAAKKERRKEPHVALLEATDDMEGKTVGYLLRSGGIEASGSQAQGRFPPIDTALPRLSPHHAVLNPAYVRDVMALALSLGIERVDFILPLRPECPVAITGHNEEGQFLDAIVMPLSEPTLPKPRGAV